MAIGPVASNLYLPVGNSNPLALPALLKPDGITPINLTGATVVTLSAKRNIGDAGFAVQKTLAAGVTVTNAAQGLVTVQFAAADTTGLSPGAYLYDVKVVDSGGLIYTPLLGVLFLVEHVNP